MKKSRKKRREDGAIYTHFESDQVRQYCIALAENRHERRLLSGKFPWIGMGGIYRRAENTLAFRLRKWGIWVTAATFSGDYGSPDTRYIRLQKKERTLEIELEVARRWKN